jgi:hypothetical protein
MTQPTVLAISAISSHPRTISAQRARPDISHPKKRNTRVGWVIDPAVGCGVRHIAGSMTQPTVLLANNKAPQGGARFFDPFFRKSTEFRSLI